VWAEKWVDYYSAKKFCHERGLQNVMSIHTYYTPCIVQHTGAQLLVLSGDPQRVERRS
jgi:hypothetical protein